MTGEPTTKQLRLHCDGELAPEESRRLEAQIAQSPQRQAQVEFERQLKARLGAVLQADGAAPAALARRIRESIVAEAPPAPAPVGLRARDNRRAHRPWW